MEPGIKEFFKRLVTSIAICILWLSITMVIGVKYNLAFFEDGVHLGNVLFYIWLIVSFAALLIFYIRLWKKPIEGLEDRH